MPHTAITCPHCQQPFTPKRRAQQFCSLRCAYGSRTANFVASFWGRVDRSGGPDSCWFWLSTIVDGYGRCRRQGRLVPAHRVAYEMTVGPIPEGLVLDHVKARGCTNKHCVNPAHLEIVTHQVNLLRGDGASGTNARKTHCPRGHEYTDANTLLCQQRYGTMRICKQCKHEKDRARHHANREQNNEARRQRKLNARGRRAKQELFG